MSQRDAIQVLRRMFAEGINVTSPKATEWLRKNLTNIGTVNPLSIINTSGTEGSIVQFTPGKLYLFGYNPKTKNELPYYDSFPMILLLDYTENGFIGLNLHYISPKQRIIFLDKLSTILNNHEYDETTRFRISYNFLKASTKMFEAKPCVKKYLFKHIESRFLEITADEWDIAALLPVEFFQKEKKNKVWMESQEQFR
jgi:hypothetical protein